MYDMQDPCMFLISVSRCLPNIPNQNKAYEWLNDKFENRLKCVRRLVSKDPRYTFMIIIYHNFFKKHDKLKDNVTPVEAIRVDIMQKICILY